MKKNILYIPHGSQDFCDDGVFCGLKDFLDIYSIDYKLSGCQFHGEEQSTIELRHEISYYLFKDDWFKTASMLGKYDGSKKYDLIILGSPWVQNQTTFNNVKHTLADNGKVVVICGSDSPNDVGILIKHNYVFYSNTINPNWENGNIIPFTCPNDLLNDDSKEIKYLLNCQMGPTHPKRNETINFVYNTMKDLNLLDSSKISLHNLSQTLLGHTSMTPFSDWWDTLKNSKIIISERGTGQETFRFWEAIATGNIVLCSPETTYIQNNVPLPPNVFIWSDYEDLKNKIIEFSKLSDEEVINNRVNIKEFLKKHHSPKIRVAKILKNIGF
jgi:hypothetical protein